MNVFLSLVFFVASVSAYRDNPDDFEYFIKNVNTNKFLYIDDPFILHSGIFVARNVCTYDIAHKIPITTSLSLFQVVSNDAIGPYYNIINSWTKTVLFASELSVGTENNVTVNQVLAWVDSEHNNSPEAMWNIRHFDDDLYILNVHYGSYLYTNDNMHSAALFHKNRRVAMLMPNEGGGRVVGTQWVILDSDSPEAIFEVVKDSKLKRVKMVTNNEGKGGKAAAQPVEKKVGVEEDEQKVN